MNVSDLIIAIVSIFVAMFAIDLFSYLGLAKYIIGVAVGSFVFWLCCKFEDKELT